MQRSIYWMIFIELIAITITGCITSQQMLDRMNGHFYKYTFAIREHTTRKQSPGFANKAFSINFDPEFTRINFTLTNHFSAPIHIVWAKTFLVIQDDSTQVIHSGIPLANRNNSQPNTTINSGQTLRDYFLPKDYVKNEEGQLRVKNLYPEKDENNSEKTDWIMGLIGVNMFKIYLTLSANGKEQTYHFTFYPIEMERGGKSFNPNYTYQ